MITNTNVQIINGTPEEAYGVSVQIPEFEPWYPWDKWQERLSGRKAIVLIAKENEDVVGFKVGYQEKDHFYSWVGGVLPEYRRMGIAHRLAEAQEELVRERGVHLIRMKTRNRFQEMLHFALSRDFYIADVERKGTPPDWRITLYKNV